MLQNQQCHGVELNPGVDLVAKVTGNPEGTTFCLDPGVYRISVPLVLRAGQELIGTGNGGTVISGAKVVTASKQESIRGHHGSDQPWDERG